MRDKGVWDMLLISVLDSFTGCARTLTNYHNRRDGDVDSGRPAHLWNDHKLHIVLPGRFGVLEGAGGVLML
jgi:hypothetical protein